VNITAASRNITKPPTTAAIIKPLPAFFSRCGDDGSKGTCDGVGEDRKEHSARGGPHNPAFPKKELFENIWRKGGIEPFSSLLLRFSCLRLGSLRSGIGPDKEFPAKFRIDNWVRFCKPDGICPVKEL